MIKLQYHPMSAVEIEGAGKVAIAVTATDARTENRDRIAKREAAFFPRFELWPLRSSVDVVTLLKEAVELELRGRGFRVGAGMAQVRLDLTKFFHTPKANAFTVTCNGEVSFHAQVFDVDGAIVYAKDVSGCGSRTVGFGGVSLIGKLLEEGLEAAVASLIGDRAFIDAVLVPGARRFAAQ